MLLVKFLKKNNNFIQQLVTKFALFYVNKAHQSLSVSINKIEAPDI